MESIIARRFLVSGEVQGVGYRFFAQQAAHRHRILGFVKNLPDGRVEAQGQGSVIAIQAFERELRQGPPFSTVDNVEQVEVEPIEGATTFHICY